ncbi:MAG: glycosyltransferase family 2 protein, partial [Cyanobacteria bacterium J083]
GLRLQYLYNLFLQVQACQTAKNPPHIFWLSRYLTAKGLFQRNCLVAYELIAQEFSHTVVNKMIPCLLPDDEWKKIPNPLDLSTEFSQALLNSQPETKIVKKIFNSPGKIGQTLRQHYTTQAKLFAAQIKNLTGNKKLAVLVDSGWQATTQKLLMQGYPEIDWHGLYFARTGSVKKNNWHFFNVIGLMFESYTYQPNMPETCIHYHHHIIEDLLEPNIPSVEYLWQNPETKTVSPPAVYVNFDASTPAQDELHYQGIIEYFQTCSQAKHPLKLLQIRQRSREAWQILNQKIRFPTPADVAILDVRSRSADFGKRERNPVVLRRARWLTERDKNTRLQHALWRQGQISLEYPQKYRKKQEEYAQKQESLPQNLPHKHKIPLVAVITRTKNRPVMLQRAAKSIANQTFRDLIWVVINDGGEPTEVNQIIQNAPVDLRQVLVIHNPTSLGMEAASNIGIKNSHSKYIVIHDDDDSWQPEFLAHTVKFLENPPVDSMKGVITHAHRLSEVIVSDKYIEIIDSCPYQDWVMTIPLYEMASMNMFAPISFLFSRQVYEEIGGFDEQLPVLGDWDFNIRFLLKYDIGVIPQKLANYHHRDYLKTGDYSNSLIGAISQHQIYESIVRNR